MLENKIQEIVESSFGLSMVGKYRNSVDISGWILMKPKYIINEKLNRETCSLIVWQMGKSGGEYVYVKSYSLITYDRNLIATLKKDIKDKVVFFSSHCTLQWDKAKNSYNLHLANYNIAAELDIDLDPPYERKK